MSYNPNDPNDPNKLKQQQAAQSTAVKPVVTPPPVVQGAPATSEQLRGAQAVGQRKGSGFTGIGRIMQANVGQRLGQQTTGQIAQIGQNVQQQTAEAAKKFQTQLGEAQQRYGTAYGIGGGVVSGLMPGQQPQPVQTPISSPGAIASQFDPATIAAYQTAISGQYTGPTGLEDYSDLQSQAQLAAQMGEAAQTAGGRSALLQRMYGRGERQYTAGQAALDALLLGKSSKELAAAKRESAGILEDVESEEEVAQALARQAGADIEAKAQALSQKVGATEAQEMARIEAQKADYEKKISDLSEKVKSEMSEGELSKDTLKALSSLGIDENTQFYGMDPQEIANLISQRSPSEITAAAVATEEQVRRMNALRRLAGGEDVFSQADVERAGTADVSTGLRFGGDLGKILQEKKKEFEGLFGGVIGEAEKRNLEAYVREEEELNKRIADLESRMRKERTPVQREQLSNEIKTLKNQKLAAAKKAGPFYGQGYGGSDVKRDLMQRFLAGDLYNKATGKLDVDFANQLKKMISERQVYKGRKGFLGLGGRVFGKDAADAARIKALEDILKRYGTGSTFKAKEE